MINQGWTIRSLGKAVLRSRYRTCAITLPCILLYLYLAYWLQQYIAPGGHMTILGIQLDQTIVRGITTQIQLILSVILVLAGTKVAFIAAVTLNLISLVSSLIFALRTGTPTSIPGAISYVTALIIIMLIWFYKNLTRSQLRSLRDQESKLKELAYYDGLTDVLNRKSFIAELDKIISAPRSNNKNFLVVFIDIDDFKAINDSLGHHAGDRILKTMASRIKKISSEYDIVGRLGGDEIGLILIDGSEEDLKKRLHHVYLEVLQPHNIDEQTVSATVSMGVAVYPQDDLSSKELLRKADIAMYIAKHEGKNRICFYQETQHQSPFHKQNSSNNNYQTS